MDPTLKTVLRVIHILSAVFWSGGTLFMVSVISPAAAETAPDSGKMMGRVAVRFRRAATIAGILALAAGLTLYYFSSGLAGGGGSAWSAWFGTKVGLWLSIGALAGLLAFVVGAAVVGPVSGRIVALGGKIAASGGPPSQEDGAEMARLQGTMNSASRIGAILFVIAILGMAAAGI